MANSYTITTADDTVPCSRELALALFRSVQPDFADADLGSGEIVTVPFGECGFSADFDPSEGKQSLYLYAEDCGQPDEIPEPVLARLAEILRAADLPHVEFGFACTSDRLSPGSHSGGAFRITTEGKLVFPEVVWDES